MTKEKLIDYISKELHDGTELSLLKEDDDILSNGLLDSIALMHLIVFIEKEIGIKIPVEDVTIGNFRTVSHMMTYLQKYQESLTDLDLIKQ